MASLILTERVCETHYLHMYSFQFKTNLWVSFTHMLK